MKKKKRKGDVWEHKMSKKSKLKIKAGKPKKDEIACLQCRYLKTYYPNVSVTALHEAHTGYAGDLNSDRVEDPIPEPDVGNLRGEARERGKLTTIFASAGISPYPLTSVDPGDILKWCEALRDYHEDKNQFLTIAGLRHYAVISVKTMREYGLVAKTIARLYPTETEAEDAAWQGVLKRALQPKPTEPAKGSGEPSKGTTATKGGNTSQPVQNGTSVTVTQKGTRYLIYGHKVTAILRWMGADAWTVADCRKALTKLGINAIQDTTIQAQTYSGRKGNDGPHGELPVLDDEQMEALNTLIEVNGHGKATVPSTGKKALSKSDSSARKAARLSIKKKSKGRRSTRH